jgi:hypothetical protein
VFGDGEWLGEWGGGVDRVRGAGHAEGGVVVGVDVEFAGCMGV